MTDAVREVISGYTRESGVRQLEREIGRVARKVARKVAAQELERVDVGAKDVRELLAAYESDPSEFSLVDKRRTVEHLVEQLKIAVRDRIHSREEPLDRLGHRPAEAPRDKERSGCADQ